MKILVPWVLLCVFLSLPCSAITILLDPGHGGDDLGARSGRYIVGKNGRRIAINEKDIVLQIARRIHRRLSSKGYRTFLTRSVDRVVALHERAALADKINADLYISIHANSSRSNKANGFEAYYLSNHQDLAVKKIEQAENRQPFSDDIMVDRILTDLVIQRTEKSSRRLAKYINREVNRAVGKKFRMTNRGVKPGLFYVLALAKRPSVLLEVGFMSNRKELAKLMNPHFQERYAAAVARGIEKYTK